MIPNPVVKLEQRNTATFSDSEKAQQKVDVLPLNPIYTQTASHNSDELEQRIALWLTLVPTIKWNDNQDTLYSDGIVFQECMQKTNKKKSVLSKGSLTEYLFKWCVILIYCGIAFLDRITFPIFSSVVFVFSIFPAYFLLISAYQKQKIKKLNALEQMSFLLRRKFTLKDKVIDDGRLVVHWEEGDERLSSTFKWFNHYGDSSQLHELIQHYPELEQLVNRLVDTYPLNTAQMLAHLNGNVDEAMKNNALREFMIYDNRLTLQDLMVLNKAYKLKQKLESMAVPKEQVHQAVYGVLEEHFQDYIKAKYEKQSTQCIFEIKNALSIVDIDMPDDFTQILKDEFKHNHKLMSFDDVNALHSVVVDIDNILNANPQVKLEWNWDWANAYQANHNCQSKSNRSLAFQALVQEVKSQHDALIQYLVQQARNDLM